jgi:hypothetical protein
MITNEDRFGVALVGAEMLLHEKAVELARHLALDIALADQLTCLSPQVIYIEEGGDVNAVRFAELLAVELGSLQKCLPRRRLSMDARLTFNRFRSRYQFRQFQSEAEATGTQVLGLEKGAEWLVVLDPELALLPGPGYRSNRVSPVDKMQTAKYLIRSERPLVSTVGLSVKGERHLLVADALGASGVRRICEIGAMPKPPLTWHHHGNFHLLPLLKWTDLEVSV